MVEKMGVEPTASAMRMLRSSQLSYFPQVNEYQKRGGGNGTLLEPL
jgi:hypothetical protein